MMKAENKTDHELKRDQSRFELAAVVSGFAVVIGLLIEVWLAVVFRPVGEPFTQTWGPVVADALIALGVIFEIMFGRWALHQGNELQQRAEKALAEATERAGKAIERAAEAVERAAKTDLARVELEKSLSARTLTKEQFDVLQKLKGRLCAVIVASDSDAEPAWFASLLANAIQKAGIEVGLLTRAAHAHSSANFVCDKRAYFNPDGEPTSGEPLFSILNEAGIPVSGVVAGYPQDLRNGDDDPMDIPMIVIGGRFPIPPKEPYLGPKPEDAAPPVTMVERMRNP
jgi:hypothetical protein